MKKLFALLLLVCALAWFAGRERTPADPADAGGLTGTAPTATAAVATPAPTVRLPAESRSAVAPAEAATAEAKPEGNANAAQPAASMLLFPDAPVVSSVTEPGPEPGQETTTKVVETKLRQPYVKIEEVYEVRNGQRTLVGQKAMVSNQLMLQRPEGLSAAAFAAALNKAGAVEVKDLGPATIVTFEARPAEPKALDGYLQRVREQLGADVTVEPNYVRKLI